MKKTILITLGIITLAIIAGGIYIFTELKSPDRKIKTFRNMHHLVNSIRISHTDIPQALNPKALPSTFEYDDESYNVADEIKDTDMT